MCVPLSSMAKDDSDSRVHLKVLGGLSYSTLSGEEGVFGPTAGGDSTYVSPLNQFMWVPVSSI